MTKKDFDLLVKKYQAGLCTKEEKVFIEKWAELHFNRQSNHSSFESDSESSRAEDRIWHAVQLSTGLTSQKKNFFNSSKLLLVRGVGVAAILLITFLIWWKGQDQLIALNSISGIETKNVTESQQRIVLPDSSIVMLEPGAVILVSDDYGQNKRDVHLKGKAFFHIKHNSEIPFLVYTGELVTEVLGTSFGIQPKENNKMIEVSVLTGKVSVYTQVTTKDKKQNGVIVKPNQKVVYNAESKTIVQDLVAKPELLSSPLQLPTFVFEETSLQEVLEQLQACYGVDILIGTPLLGDCMFTGDLGGLGLYEQLDHLCEVIHAQYVIRGTAIFITGNGCSATESN